MGIVVAGLEVIEAAFVVVDVASVAQGVVSAQVGGALAGDAQDVAPGIVGILHHRDAIDGKDRRHIALLVGHIEVTVGIPLHIQRRAIGAVAEPQSLAVHRHLTQLIAVVDVAVGGVAVGPLRPQAVCVVGVGPGFLYRLDLYHIGSDAVSGAVRDDAAVAVAQADICNVETGKPFCLVAGSGGVRPGAAAVGADLPLIAQAAALGGQGEGDLVTHDALEILRLLADRQGCHGQLRTAAGCAVARAVRYNAAEHPSVPVFRHRKIGDGIGVVACRAGVIPCPAIVDADLPLIAQTRSRCFQREGHRRALGSVEVLRLLNIDNFIIYFTVFLQL